MPKPRGNGPAQQASFLDLRQMHEFEKTLPGGAKELLEMAKRDQSHSHKIELEDLALERRGQTFAFFIALTFLCASAVLVMAGHGVEGTVMATVDLVGLVTVFIVGSASGGVHERAQTGEGSASDHAQDHERRNRLEDLVRDVAEAMPGAGSVSAEADAERLLAEFEAERLRAEHQEERLRAEHEEERLRAEHEEERLRAELEEERLRAEHEAEQSRLERVAAEAAQGAELSEADRRLMVHLESLRNRDL